MYDFEGAREDGTPQLGAPSRLLTLLEFPRWVGEYATSRAWDLVAPSKDDGDGRPVLVLPGFNAADTATGRLRNHLRRRGYHAHGWGLGRNVGLTDRIVGGLLERFDALHERHGQPVSVIGWSFGGLLTRWVAHQRPEATRQIICLASPWRPEGEHTHATRMFERSRRQHGISERAHDILAELREPVPVPVTAIWSRSDGIVPWRGCVVDERDAPAIAENIEVVSSHVGMGSNPLVLTAVTDRLGQDPAEWQPFSWRGEAAA